MTEKLINWSRQRKKLMRQRGRKCQIELFKMRVEKQSNILRDNGWDSSQINERHESSVKV